MPAWTLKSTAAKMLQNLSSNTAPRQRKGSIDVHARSTLYLATQVRKGDFWRACKAKAKTAKYLSFLAHFARHVSKRGYGPGGRTDPEFTEIRNLGDDENWTPGPDEKAKGTLVDRNRRRHGMMYYPEGVRDELRRTRTRSRSPRVKTQFTPSPTSSFCSDQIVVSSARHDKAVFEPPSWFSIASESDDPSRFSLSTSDDPPSGRVLSVASEPSSAKSWETFCIPSVPPSPVDSAESAVSATPRDPRLPPADYLLYKDMYDDAMIKMHGKLPAEWVAYTHRHFPGPNRI